MDYLDISDREHGFALLAAGPGTPGPAAHPMPNFHPERALSPNSSMGSFRAQPSVSGAAAMPLFAAACLVAVLLKPAAVAVPLAAASILASAAFARAMRARMVEVDPAIIAAFSAALIAVAALRPAVFLPSIAVAILLTLVWNMRKIEHPGLADALFAPALGLVLCGVMPAHVALAAVSVFAGGESMGRAFVVIYLFAGSASLLATGVAERSLRDRLYGPASLLLAADVAGGMASLLVCLIASTLRKPAASTLAFAALALAIEAGIAIGRRLSDVFATGGRDPEEIVDPALARDTAALSIFISAGFSGAIAFYVGRLFFV